MAQVNIKTIDLYITDGKYAMADISMESPYVYYCFGTEDVREDGRVTAGEEAIGKVINEIADIVNSNDIQADSPTCYRVRLSLGMSDGRRCEISDNQLSDISLKKIIDALSDRFDDLMFLMSFR